MEENWRELIARIKLQFRNQSAPPKTLEAGGLTLDRTSCQVRQDGTPPMGMCPGLPTMSTASIMPKGRVVPVKRLLSRLTGAPVGGHDACGFGCISISGQELFYRRALT